MLICAVAMILCGTRQVGAMQQQSAIHGYMVAVRLCPSTQLRCSPVTLLSPGDLWAAYEAAADADSVLTDVVTAASINTVSDCTAQASQLRSSTLSAADPARTARFCVFGAADGYVSHIWFEALDDVVGEDGSAAQTLLKVACDALVYTPLWCAWFLAAFVLLEGRAARSIPSVVTGEWLELYRGNVGFFLPLTGLIYVPICGSDCRLAE
jgi:hypothetical protein